MNLETWLQSGKYLPPALRDFHHQKDVFKAMHQIIKPGGGSDVMDKVSWVTGQIYVIDIFLWFMARRGNTLQRSRKKLEYINLDETVRKCKSERDASDARALGLTPIRDRQHD